MTLGRQLVDPTALSLVAASSQEYGASVTCPQRADAWGHEASSALMLLKASSDHS